MAQGEGSPGLDCLTLMCWNINGLIPTLPNFKLKHKSFAGFFAAHQLDVLCLQEVKVPEAKLTEEMACVSGFESFWAICQEKKGYSGVTTWCRTPSWSPVAAAADDVGAETGGDTDLDREGRLVITDMGAFVLANVYVPNVGQAERLEFKCRFMQALRTRLLQYKHQGRPVILVGDLNVAATPQDVHPTFKHENRYDQREVQLLHALTAEFTDVWRVLHPDVTDGFTVWEERTGARAFNAGTRIDFVLISPELMPHVVSCEIITDMPPKWSDHAPLLLKLKGVQPPPPHPPCALSSKRMKRFMRGPSVFALLTQGGNAAKRSKVQPAAEQQQQAAGVGTSQAKEAAGDAGNAAGGVGSQQVEAGSQQQGSGEAGDVKQGEAGCSQAGEAQQGLNLVIDKDSPAGGSQGGMGVGQASSGSGPQAQPAKSPGPGKGGDAKATQIKAKAGAGKAQGLQRDIKSFFVKKTPPPETP